METLKYDIRKFLNSNVVCVTYKIKTLINATIFWYLQFSFKYAGFKNTAKIVF